MEHIGNVVDQVTREMWDKQFKNIKCLNQEISIPYFEDFRLGFGSDGYYDVSDKLTKVSLFRRRNGNICLTNYKDVIVFEKECTFENYLEAIDLMKRICNKQFDFTKALFVRELSDVLKRYIPAIVKLEYISDGLNDKVMIYYQGSERTVYVNYDSIIGILADVTKAIAGGA